MPHPAKHLHLSQPASGTGRDAALHAAPEDILRVAARLLEREWFLEDITGLDVAEGIALLYHFAHWTIPGRIAVRVLLDHGSPLCPSIESVFPGAAWHEREARDFFSVVFEGASNDAPLLLHEHLDPPPLIKAAQARVALRMLWPQAEQVEAARMQSRIADILGGENIPGEPS